MALDIETRDQLLETVRRFVRETCMPIEAKVAEEDRVPDSVIDQMRALGLFGLSIPTEYGGLGLTMEEEVLVAMELGRVIAEGAPQDVIRDPLVIASYLGSNETAVARSGTRAKKANRQNNKSVLLT